MNPQQSASSPADSLRTDSLQADPLHAEAREVLRRLTAVSYTHLDVYKRQVLLRCGHHGYW